MTIVWLKISRNLRGRAFVDAIGFSVVPSSVGESVGRVGYIRAISLVESLVTFVGMDESRYTTAETIQVVNRLNSTPWNSATICKPVTWMSHKWSNIFNPNKNQLNTIITIFPLISLIFSTLLHDSPNVQFYRNYKKKEKRKFCNIQIPITAHATL